MRIAGDGLGGVTGEIDQNFLGGDHDVDGVAVGFDVEGAVRGELHEVERREVAGGVVEEHVLAAGIAGVDAGGVLGGVPAVDGGIELHAGIAAVPGSFGDLAQEIAGLVGLVRGAVLNVAGGEVGVALGGEHELVVNADGVVGVLEKDGGVGGRVGIGAVVTFADERVRLLLFRHLAINEVGDVGMVDVEDDHLGGATGLAAAFDDAGEGVEAAHEAERTGSGAAAVRDSCAARSGLRLVPVPEPHLKSMASVLARFMMESMESLTELMKQAEHCGLR